VSHLERISRFHIVAVVGAALQLALVHILVSTVGWGGPSATALAVVLVVVHNFVWHWRWTWRDRAHRPASGPRAFLRFVLTNGVVSIAGGWVIVAASGSLMQLPPVAANVVAIAVCGLVNYCMADRLVFSVAGSSSSL
jgi:putative flippase GtrA